MLIIGLLVYWFARPSVFQTNPFTEQAFEFWLLKWLVYVVIWGLLAAKAEPDRRWVLASVDLNTTFGLGFFWVYFKGPTYKERRTLINLVFIYGLLLAWNFSFANWASRAYQSPIWLGSWYFPSEVGSAALILMALVVLVRYRKPAMLFFGFTLAYMIFQQPTYKIVFGLAPTASDPVWLFLLAGGKLLYSIAFYGLCFNVPKDVAEIDVPWLAGVRSPALGRVLKFALAILALGVAAVLTLLMGEALHQHPSSLWRWILFLPSIGGLAYITGLLLDFLIPRQR